MKCLSMKQPFADFVVDGRKTIELRGWNTKFRGLILIQASMKPDISACKKRNINPKSLTVGAIIGQVEIYDVKEYKTKKELTRDKDKHLALEDLSNYHYKYGFLLKNAVKFKNPIPCKGQLNIFEVNLKTKG